MMIYCGAFFYEFELEIEHIKKTNFDPISLAKQALQYIEVKLKELFQWLKKFKFNSVDEEILSASFYYTFIYIFFVC